jgi:regulator of replication initiation timing
MLRISLVIAILAGLGVLYFTHFNVQESITTLRTDLEESQRVATQARSAEQTAKVEASRAREELAEAAKQLNQRTAALEATTQTLAEQERRANQLFDELSAITRERNEARQELATWRALGLGVDEVEQLHAQTRRAREERDAYLAENQILVRANNQLQARLSRYEGDPEVQLPVGLRGNVLAVDPKYDFVVLDIGENQGVVENARMLVNRNGKLVGKVLITRVHPNRSIANVLPDAKQDEIMEGDQVFY